MWETLQTTHELGLNKQQKYITENMTEMCINIEYT